MAWIVLFLFLAVPLVEIAVFIEVGGWLGLWPTLAVIVATAVAGTALLRWQGLSTLARAQAALDRGQLPVAEVFDGACLLVAGALLLTPGFVTDAVGGLLFLPPFRALLRGLIAHRLTAGLRAPRPEQGPDGVIDGEWEEVVVEKQEIESSSESEPPERK
ncbi:MAG: FxsA family protein [Alphaproteobacteria bacterium]|nr:FxsA family protein [Alphaproteobacteria bacterium]